MVPETTWQQNVRAWLTATQWDKVRKKVYVLYGGKCAVCHTTPAKGRLHCHEVWRYNDDAHIQTLTGLVAMCHLCHAIKHIACSLARSREGTLNFEALIGHFCRINGCGREEFDRHFRDVVAQHAIRSSYTWSVNTIVDLEELVGSPLPPHVPRPPYCKQKEDSDAIVCEFGAG